MRARDCFNCGKPAEPPFIIAMSESKSLGVLCGDCFDQLCEDEATVKEIRSGRRCYVCCDVLDPPGGTAVTLEGTLRRVCPSCKNWVEHLA